MVTGDFARLPVSSPDSPLEREAEAVADRLANASSLMEVAREPYTPISEASSRTVQASVGSPSPSVAPRSSPLGGAGRSLPGFLRAAFGRLLGFDVGRVRVHDGPEAAAAAAALGAQAFTVGSDIVFGAGQYAPATATGRHLIAHELTHAVQQAGSAGRTVMRKPGTPSAVSDATIGGGVVPRRPKMPAASGPAPDVEIEMDPLIMVNGVPTIDRQVFLNRCLEALASNEAPGGLRESLG